MASALRLARRYCPSLTRWTTSETGGLDVTKNAEPELIEVKSAVLGQSKTGRKVVEFNLNVLIKRPRDKDKSEDGKSRSAKPQERAA